MKTPIFNSLAAALTHAKFDDDEVGDQLDNLLKELDKELADEGYEASVLVEQAAARLDTALGEADNKAEAAEDATKEGDDDLDVDP